MNIKEIPPNPYLLLTPGPLTTTPTVRGALLRDWCTWDEEYKALVQDIRAQLTALATPAPGYTSVLMQGSGTFCVEATLTTALPPEGKLLVLANGAYGRRMSAIAHRCRLPHTLLDFGDLAPPHAHTVDQALERDPAITHLALVHCETTTGMLNPVAPIARMAKARGIGLILDAMSSFGGIPLDMDQLGVDFLISSANKCIQGVPGFGFVMARTKALAACSGHARSLSLDLFDQWQTMEKEKGKWRFTSPTHGVRAFAQALEELVAEGGIPKRHQRYIQNQRILREGMMALGFAPLLPPGLQSPIITAFLYPDHPGFNFDTFYQSLKSLGFVIYPGKVTERNTFRMGNIGDIHPRDMEKLIQAVSRSLPPLDEIKHSHAES